MRKVRLATLLVLLSGLTAGTVVGAADAPIAGADKPVPVNSFADLSVKVLPGDQVNWEVNPEPVKLVDKGDGFLYFSGPPGTRYRVSVFVVNFDTRRFDRGRAEVVMADAPRPPPVDPDVDNTDDKKPPKPKPDPVNGTAARVVVIVAENLVARTPQQAAVIYDKDLRDWLNSTRSEIELVSNKDPAYKANGYATYEAELGLPFALVFDADKDRTVAQKPLAKFKLPDTGAAFKAEVGKAVRK